MADHADKSTALWVLKRLRKADHQALFAGGCVRDMLLGVRSADYDIATDATPQQVAKLFRRVLLVGAKFGVAMVIRNRRRVEVATFRSDASYSDGRRPDHVTFSTPREDAMRRDFTINGMFYDPLSDEVIDYVGGRADLRRNVLRTIGSPSDRFAEDYLRMLRAVRFAVRLDFHVDEATVAGIKSHAGQIVAISGERIYDELSRMLAGPDAAKALRMLDELQLARQVLGELYEKPTLWPDAVRRVERVQGRKDLVLALAALLSDLPGGSIRKIVRRWGASNELRDALVWMAGHRDGWGNAERIALCQFKRLMSNASFDRLRQLWRVREQLQTGQTTQARRIARRAGAIAPQSVSPPPLINGQDLKKLGCREGRPMGQLLRAIYDAQLDERIHTAAEARALARKLLG